MPDIDEDVMRELMIRSTANLFARPAATAETLRWQRQRRLIIFHIQHRRLVGAAVENMFGRDVAALDRGQYQHARAGLLAAIALLGDALPRKALAPMFLGFVRFLQRRQHLGQAAMRFQRGVVDPQRGLQRAARSK